MMIEELARHIIGLQATLQRHGLGELMALEIRGLQLTRIQAEAGASDPNFRMSTARSICGVVLKTPPTQRKGW